MKNLNADMLFLSIYYRVAYYRASAENVQGFHKSKRWFTARNYRVMMLRLLKGKTYKEIGDLVGLWPESVRRIIFSESKKIMRTTGVYLKH